MLGLQSGIALIPLEQKALQRQRDIIATKYYLFKKAKRLSLKKIKARFVGT